jgi:hypothetical protein
MTESGTAGKIKQGAIAGLKKGLKGFFWMLRILVPVSFATSLLAWSGLLETVSAFLAPVMGILHLPGMAALPLVIGGTTGIYGGIAAMASQPLAPSEATLVAIFLLMAHNLILEGIIQGKSGINGIVVTLFRIGTAGLTTFACGFFVGSGPGALSTSGALDASGALGAGRAAASAAAARVPFLSFVESWGLGTVRLVGKILIIIMALLVLLEILKSLGWIRRVVKALRPALRVLGLGEEAGYMWTAAAIFGLAYCAPIIVEEAQAGQLAPRELTKLHLSISINHSIVEDPLLFIAAGVGAFWVFVPRLVIAILAVWLLSLWRGNRSKGRRGMPPA